MTSKVIERNPGPNHRPGYRVSQFEAFRVDDMPAETADVYSVEISLEGWRKQLPRPSMEPSVQRHRGATED
jgi:hypothetical protein